MPCISSTSGLNSEKYDALDKSIPTFNCDSGVTIYVDDNNIAGPWDGTFEHPYRYIQDGIDGAGNGDTVYVFKGYYRENIIIEWKSIDLIGENKRLTIIAGNDNDSTVILAHSNKSKIDSFTVENQPARRQGCDAVRFIRVYSRP